MLVHGVPSTRLSFKSVSFYMLHIFIQNVHSQCYISWTKGRNQIQNINIWFENYVSDKEGDTKWCMTVIRNAKIDLLLKQIYKYCFWKSYRLVLERSWLQFLPWFVHRPSSTIAQNLLTFSIVLHIKVHPERDLSSIAMLIFWDEKTICTSVNIPKHHPCKLFKISKLFSRIFRAWSKIATCCPL